jgi:hypothetical protein
MISAIIGIWSSGKSSPKEFLGVIVDSVLLASCQEIVTLNATIIGDASAHTFLWEQIAGPPVIWLEPQNQITVLYQKPNTPGDATFRFWIDKNTQFQQFRDLTVTSEALETVETQISAARGGVISFIGAPQNLYFAPTFSNYEAVTRNQQNRLLMYDGATALTHLDKQVGYEINRIENGTAQVIATVQPSTLYYGLVFPNTTYSVSTLYDQFTRRVIATSSPASFLNTDDELIDTSEIAAPTVFSSPGTISLFQRTFLELLSVETPEDSAISSSHTGLGTGEISLFQRTTLTLVELEPEAESAESSFGAVANKQSSILRDAVLASPGLISI